MTKFPNNFSSSSILFIPFNFQNPCFLPPNCCNKKWWYKFPKKFGDFPGFLILPLVHGFLSLISIIILSFGQKKNLLKNPFMNLWKRMKMKLNKNRCEKRWKSLIIYTASSSNSHLIWCLALELFLIWSWMWYNSFHFDNTHIHILLQSRYRMV